MPIMILMNACRLKYSVKTNDTTKQRGFSHILIGGRFEQFTWRETTRSFKNRGMFVITVCRGGVLISNNKTKVKPLRFHVTHVRALAQLHG